MEEAIPSHAEALTEIRRLRAERDVLHARIAELEASLAMAFGSMERVAFETDEPATIVHNVQPNAPPHG